MDIVLSGIRPTGQLHLGNYFGALRNFVRMQYDAKCYFFIADYHAMTTHTDPAHLHDHVKTILSEYLAAGINPDIATIYVQSDVPQVAELSLLLSMHAYVGEHGCCSVNPTLGEERRFDSLPSDGKGRTVAIIGGGVAGLTAAEILGRRGFKPVVFEKENVCGGQINLADKGPKKEKIGWCAQDLETNARKFGAEIRFGKEATAADILALDPYAVIVATGAVALRPRSINGADGANVYTTTQILDGSVRLEGKNVALIGTGMTGLETGELLAEQGNKLTFVEMADTVAPGTWFQHIDDAMPKLEKAGAKFMLSTKLVSIDEKGAVVEGVKDKKQSRVDADAVVLSLGARPVNGLAKELEGKVKNLFVVGDADKVGRIAHATAEAYDVAMNKIK